MLGWLDLVKCKLNTYANLSTKIIKNKIFNIKTDVFIKNTAVNKRKHNHT